MRGFINCRLILTLIFVIGLLVIVLARKDPALVSSWAGWIRNETGPNSHSPEDAIYAMLDAERAGDTKRYLDAFSGAIHDRLDQVINEESPTKFGSYLARNADFQRVAITVTDRTAQDEVQARAWNMFTAIETKCKNFNSNAMAAGGESCKLRGPSQSGVYSRLTPQSRTGLDMRSVFWSALKEAL